MQTVRSVVDEEIDLQIPYRHELPADLHAVVDRHYDCLIGLAESLLAAGRDQSSVRLMVSQLLRTYETDLLAVLEARK